MIATLSSTIMHFVCTYTNSETYVDLEIMGVSTNAA